MLIEMGYTVFVLDTAPETGANHVSNRATRLLFRFRINQIQPDILFRRLYRGIPHRRQPR